MSGHNPLGCSLAQALLKWAGAEQELSRLCSCTFQWNLRRTTSHWRLHLSIHLDSGWIKPRACASLPSATSLPSFSLLPSLPTKGICNRAIVYTLTQLIWIHICRWCWAFHSWHCKRVWDGGKCHGLTNSTIYTLEGYGNLLNTSRKTITWEQGTHFPRNFSFALLN